MKKSFISLVLLICTFALHPEYWGQSAFARSTDKSKGKTTPKPPSLAAVCSNPVAMADLEVNNVRCRILTAGDLWWDYTTQLARYEIPKNSKLYSIYAGALWVGGYDLGGQLHVAAQTYGHSTGDNDWWPGPLDTTNASVNQDVCAQYDKLFRITRKEVETFVSNGTITPGISTWPGNGDQSKGQSQYLAPFFDKNNDGIYTPSAGDYPGFDLVANDGYGDCQTVNCIPVDQLFGDECLWWVFNDKGDVHLGSSGSNGPGGNPIGLEVRAQAFGFSTDDEINNMTFYNYRIYNRSTFQLDTTYFGVWCDADLGNYQDDWVGCDVKRGLGYTYNGDDDDDVSAGGYGLNPPAVGIDFFRGPITNPAGVPGDGKDNNRNCQVDEPCEQAIMSKFVYYTNGAPFPQSDPRSAVEYYNYLSGKWQNGVRFTYGGTGIGGTVACDFCFPGNTDHQYEWGTGGNCQNPAPAQADWSEIAPPNDRRFMESAGPFTLLPGAVNVVTYGVVWARATSGGAKASVKLLQVVDDKAQALFDNCFKVLDGPTAPDVTIQELDKQLILYLSNTDPQSNNFNETYTEFDPLISLVDTGGNTCTNPAVDKYYHFEGYKIYQLSNASVSANDLDNSDKARLVFQCDLKNGVSRLINYEFDANLGAGVPKEKVNGADAGIIHSIKITTDAFATGDPTLINHKTYYFMALAYGYNQYKKYQQDTPPSGDYCDPAVGATTGQKKPYKQGRKNLKSYSAIPHIPMAETGGTSADGSYGAGPVITRIEGNGNGGMTLDFSSATVSSILSAPDSRVKTPEYLAGAGPVNVKVVDPLNVPDGNTFTLMIKDTATPGNLSDAYWLLINTSTNDTVRSDKTIQVANEQLVLKWGLSVTVEQVKEPGDILGNKNGFLSATMTFSDGSKKWLKGIADQDGPFYTNWIRSGTVANSPGDPFQDDYTNQGNPNASNYDNNQIYEGVLGGTWAPFRLCAISDPALITSGNVMNPSKYYTGPGFGINTSQIMGTVKLFNLASVDVVLTSDQSKWSRCVVLEMCEDTAYSANTANAANKARKMDYRRAPSVDKNGNPATIGSGASTNPNAPNYISDIGMGWFPGYAVNLETGERLNIAFGENSALSTRASSKVINYNLRGNLSYTNLKNGPFIPLQDTIADYTSKATAVIVTDNSSNSMVVKSISGIISPLDIIVGKKSGAKAIVSAFTSNPFPVNGETITATPSGATATIQVNNNASSVMLLTNVSGTFTTSDVITGSSSGAFAGIISYSSYNFEQNGADMKWNPTSKSKGTAPWTASTTAPVFGGQHYIYIFGHNTDNSGNDTNNLPRYDAGKKIFEILNQNNAIPIDVARRNAFRDAMWVNIPLLATGYSLLQTDVTIRLRVSKAYKKGYSAAMAANPSPPYASDTVSGVSKNGNIPMYQFNTNGIATHTNMSDLAKSALDLIKVVPNPYYAFSLYETSTFDNRVKITNLPEQFTVSIYNLGGALIRKYQKADPATNHTPKGANSSSTWHDGSLDWDLKNTAGIPISSGVYIIHVEVPGVGEKIVKWFGIMRPIDLDSF